MLSESVLDVGDAETLQRSVELKSTAVELSAEAVAVVGLLASTTAAAQLLRLSSAQQHCCGDCTAPSASASSANEPRRGHGTPTATVADIGSAAATLQRSGEITLIICELSGVVGVSVCSTEDTRSEQVGVRAGGVARRCCCCIFISRCPLLVMVAPSSEPVESSRRRRFSAITFTAHSTTQQSTTTELIETRQSSVHVQQQVCLQLHTPADNMALLAVAAEHRPRSNRLLSPARRAHSSKPAAAACGGRMMGQTDRHRTVTQTLLRILRQQSQ